MQGKQPLLTTGLSGLVGSKFAQLYQDKYIFQNLDLRDLKNPIDITDAQSVYGAVAKSSAETLVHLAAFTDVDQAWKQAGDETGLAFQVNVVGTHNIVQACQEFDKKIIHISTAYVFDGKQENAYKEEDQPNPIEWYGQTKWEAEQIVINSDLDWVILRIDQPFRPDAFEKLDLAHRIMERLKYGNLPPMFSDHYFSPTYLPDFSKILDFFVQSDQTGLFHATSGEIWTDLGFAQEIKDAHNLPGTVSSGELINYLATLDRPYQKNTALNVKKLKNLIGFQLTPITNAVKQLRM